MDVVKRLKKLGRKNGAPSKAKYVEVYTNTEMRKKMFKWLETHDYGTYKNVAEEIGISYFAFIRWKNNQRELGQPSLYRIADFLKRNR